MGCHAMGANFVGVYKNTVIGDAILKSLRSGRALDIEYGL
jgi:hypothetical protein